MDLLALTPVLAPLALVVAAVLAHLDRGARPRLALAATRAATRGALVVAAATAVIAVVRGPQVSPLLGFDGLGLSVRIDGLSVVMLGLCAVLGSAVIEFSRNYLGGDRRQAMFLGSLSLTVACVMLLVLSGNLVQLALTWSATSLALHRLLLFYPERPGAVIAARKKFLVARAGDACLVAASVLLVRALGTGDIGGVLEAANALARSGAVPVAIHVAAALIAVTAVLKAAQFPTHGWLIEMQETPTPVSALLHAGILNGGTFLVARLAGVMALSTPALAALVVVGGFTAIFASVVMITDTRVKVTLAYSSAAHMGFMLFLCGIGAYAVAVVHLVAHSFYKAHAFLSSGSAVEIARASWVPGKGAKVPLGRILFAYLATAAIVWGVATLAGVSVFASATNLALAAVMVFALSHLMAQGASGEPSGRVLGKVALMVGVTAVAFYALEHGGAALLGEVVPEAKADPILVALIGVVTAGFGIVTLVQLLLPGVYTSPAWASAYVLARNGLYANVWFDRLVGAGKVAKSPAPAVTKRGHPEGGSTDGRARPSPDAITRAVDRVTHAVAPVWPLRGFVAVNPFLGLADRTLAEAAETVARTAGARITMPRSFYAEAIASGRIGTADITAALAEARSRGRSGLPPDAARLIALTREQGEVAAPTLVPTVADIATAITGRDWNQILVERVGAWAATYFDEGQASWRSPWRELSAYAAFRAEAALDATPELLGAHGFRASLAKLPADAPSAVQAAIERLGIPEASVELYLQRLLASVGGWAAYARYRLWDNELYGRADSALAELLAVRLAWEVALLDAFAASGAQARWSAARMTIADAPEETARDLDIDLVLQSAYEKSWQTGLLDKLVSNAKAPTKPRSERPLVQAAFCIDVRSEVFRRALEGVAHTQCETIGFAGFFGFPIEYIPLGHDSGGAQCPVLLTPSGVIVETVVGASNDAAAEAARARLLDRRSRNAWKAFKTSAISCFGFVGPIGLAYLPKLVGDALGVTRPVPNPSRDGISPRAALGPELARKMHGGRQVGLTEQERAAMAEGLLRGMSLTAGFGRFVMLTGHGSTTVNNPHAAGLDCGACGGHTGEANARTAALVLNEVATRAALATKGITIPEDTVFIGALHDTTTDQVTLFDRHLIPSSHSADLRRLEAHLEAASAIARRLRAPLLGEDPTHGAIDAKVVGRSRDWAQVRPEWGLAGCAAFIVAPRHRTAGTDLAGRSFLHSYAWREDEAAGFGVLELVMTAPMVVGSWISLQYYASTVDNRAYGCGNKVLHNVVGTLGVLEGNGGDLRVGLPWQSVHDGERFVHEPLRLNVVIEAPIDAMNAILAKHPGVRSLVDNGWLHLYALGDAGVITHRYVGALAWESVDAASGVRAA